MKLLLLTSDFAPDTTAPSLTAACTLCIAHGSVMAERAAKRSRQAGIALGHSIGICPWSDMDI